MFYIFDSGVGGIAVLNQIEKCYPNIDLTYLCDEKNVRYGELTKDQLNLKLNLLLQKIKKTDHLFIACNTLSTVYFEQNFKLPNVYTMFDLYDLIDENLLENLIATKYTVNANVYQKKYHFKKQIIGDNLAQLIENFEFNQIINLIKQKEQDIDSIILGCTHYELFKNYFKCPIAPSEYIPQVQFKNLKIVKNRQIIFAGPSSMKEQFKIFRALTNGVIIATHNHGKLKEFQAEFENAISLKQLKFNLDVEEPFETLEKNAIHKLNEYSKYLKFNLIVDDSGLFVNSLDGKPGVYSARYAADKQNKAKPTDQENNHKLLTKMLNQSNRTAYFKCVLAANINNSQIIAKGIVSGQILNEAIGNNGFGYSPIFQPTNTTISHAQMDDQTKKEYSHRYKAIQKLKTAINQMKESNE